MAAPDFPWPTGWVDDAARWLPRPRRTQISEIVLPHCRAEWVRAERSGTARAILYFHGGAFLTCGLNTHRALVSCLSRSADAPVLSVGYRMLPRYPISSAVADALDGYRWLCETGYGAGDIVVAGDSAGGYLAFMTALSIPAVGLPKPAGVVAISPLTDIRPDRSGCEKAARCSVIPPQAATVFARYVARTQSRITVHGELGPLTSPVAEDLRDMPPVMIHAGADELLRGDAELDRSTTDIRRAVRPSSLAGTGARVRGRRTRHTGKQTRDRDNRAIRARRDRRRPSASERGTHLEPNLGHGSLNLCRT